MLEGDSIPEFFPSSPISWDMSDDLEGSLVNVGKPDECCARQIGSPQGLDPGPKNMPILENGPEDKRWN